VVRDWRTTTTTDTREDGGQPQEAVAGIGYRDWLAGQIAAAIVARAEHYSAHSVAREAVCLTDALIEELERSDG